MTNKTAIVTGLILAVGVMFFTVRNITTHELPGTIPEPIVHPFLSLAVAIIMSLIILWIIFSEGKNEK